MTEPSRKPLKDLNTAVVLPPAKKQRLATLAPRKESLKTTEDGEERETNSYEQILVRQWLKLPQSHYSIHYDLEQSKTYRYPPAKNTRGFSMLEMAADKSPFELKMQELKFILNEKFPSGAGLLFIREIFEPGDPEYCHLQGAVKVSTLTQDQVARLRIMIVDDRLQEVMVPWLGFYDRLPFGSICNVVDHFEHWKNVYGKFRDYRAKFNQIFCFTFALNKFDAWMYRMERGLGRSKMVGGLATRWKNLLSNQTPEELNLDLEFSYPAIKALLESFKAKVENAPTFGDPKMIFKYE